VTVWRRDRSGMSLALSVLANAGVTVMRSVNDHIQIIAP